MGAINKVKSKKMQQKFDFNKLFVKCFVESIYSKCIFAIVVIFTFSNKTTIAQQGPLFTQYVFNPVVLNPAYCGSREVMSFAMLARNQWAGIEGAPKTQTLSFNSPLQNKKMGIGVHLSNDKIGAYSSSGFLASYAYRISTGPGKLSFGLRAGIYRYSFNWNELEFKQKSDYLSNYTAPNKIVPTIDFGMYYYTNTFYSGFCISHLNKPQFTPKLSSNDTINPKSTLRPDFVATIGKAFVVDEKLTFRPSALLRVTPTHVFVDVNMAVLIRERIWLGLGYRSTRALMCMFEYNFASGLKIGYSFELMQNKLQTVSRASHEIFLGWDLIRYKQKTLSIRYF